MTDETLEFPQAIRFTNWRTETCKNIFNELRDGNDEGISLTLSAEQVVDFALLRLEEHLSDGDEAVNDAITKRLAGDI